MTPEWYCISVKPLVYAYGVLQPDGTILIQATTERLPNGNWHWNAMTRFGSYGTDEPSNQLAQQAAVKELERK